MSVADVYNLEGIIDASAQAVLQAAPMNLTAATPLDAPKFQKNRPRVEIRSSIGEGLGRFVPVQNGAIITPGTPNFDPKSTFFFRRETAWSFRIQFDVITSTNIEEHEEYRSTVRNATAQLWSLINNVAPMVNHAVQLARDGGSSPMQVAPEEGLMKTEIFFDGNISIQAYAWAQLLV